MRIAVIGGQGQLGSDVVRLARHHGNEVEVWSHREVPVESADAVDRAVADREPDAVVNCAAFHDLLACEREPLQAFAVNSVGALNVARSTAQARAINVYISTDYVFDGRRRTPYNEDYPPNPLSVYAASKLSGELLTRSYSDRSLVLRVSGLYGAVPCRAKGENFITKMLRLSSSGEELKIVDDEVLSPTPTAVIAARLLELLDLEAQGLYHLTSEGECSWFEFASEIFRLVEQEVRIRPVSSSYFGAAVSRPAYSVLANQRLSELEVEPMPHWRTGLQEFLGRQPAPADAPASESIETLHPEAS